MWKFGCYRFPSRDALYDAAGALGWLLDGTLRAPGMSFIEAGIVHPPVQPPAPRQGEGMADYLARFAPPTALPGYHVVVAYEGAPPPWASYAIPFESGIPTFAGLDDGPAIPAVPDGVTNAQGMAALRAVIRPDGKSMMTWMRERIDGAVEATQALPEADPRRIRADMAWIGWHQTNTWLRRGATVQAMAEQAGMTQAEVDALFVTAAGIEL